MTKKAHRFSYYVLKNKPAIIDHGGTTNDTLSPKYKSKTFEDAINQAYMFY